MKRACSTILLILAVLACGCTTAPQAAPAPDEIAIPSLIGTWTGTLAGYEEGTGFTDYNKTRMSMVVTGQEGQVFSGHLIFTFSGTESIVPMAGVIGQDGRTISLVEKDNGYSHGTLIAPDEFELTWAKDTTPYGIALNVLKRA